MKLTILKILLCSIFIGQSIFTFGQQYFGNLYDYNDNNSILEFSRAIHKLGNGNILNVSGGRVNSAGYSGRIIRMINEDGELLWEDYINLDTISIFHEWQHNSIIIDDSLLVIFASAQQDLYNYNYPYFLKYNLNTQTLLDFKFYEDFNYRGSIYSAILHSDGYIYGSGFKATNSDWSQRDFLVMKIDVNGNLIWQHSYNYNDADVLSEIEQFGNDIIVSGWSFNELAFNSKVIYTIIDNEGVVKKDKEHISIGFSGNHGLEIKDNYIYYANLAFEELYDNQTEYIAKFDEDLEIVWDTLLPQSSKFGLSTRRMEILNDEIIIAGNIKDAHDYMQVPFFYTWSYASSWSLDGELNWEHVYFYDSLNVHHIDDIVAADNGDLIFMGTVAYDYYSIGPPKQDMWLFRTDANGCAEGIVQDTCYYTLEEYFGIDTVVSINDNWLINNSVKVLCNPFTENLKFQIENTNSTKMHYEVLDLNGRIVKFGKVNSSTNNVNLNQTENGFYFLNIYKNNQKIFSKKLLKTN